MSKTFLFQAIQLSQTVLIQTIQFSMSIEFVHTQLNVKTVLFQTIQFSVSTVSMWKTVLFQEVQFSISTQFNIKTVSFQIIQFSISMHFSSIWAIDWTLSGTTTPGQSWPGSDGNEEVLRIPQSSMLSAISRTFVGVGYPSAEMQSVYSTAPADWAIGDLFYRKNPENFIHLILQDRLWFVCKPCGSKDQFQFLAQFPVAHLPYLVVSLFALICCIRVLCV